MTDTIEQAEESLASGDICVFECKQVISKLVDELKESNRQRDELRKACKELATWDADDFLVWYDTDHSDFLVDWDRFKQALKES